MDIVAKYSLDILYFTRQHSKFSLHMFQNKPRHYGSSITGYYTFNEFTRQHSKFSLHMFQNKPRHYGSSITGYYSVNACCIFRL